MHNTENTPSHHHLTFPQDFLVWSALDLTQDDAAAPRHRPRGTRRPPDPWCPRPTPLAHKGAVLKLYNIVVAEMCSDDADIK